MRPSSAYPFVIATTALAACSGRDGQAHDARVGVDSPLADIAVERSDGGQDVIEVDLGAACPTTGTHTCEDTTASFENARCENGTCYDLSTRATPGGADLLTFGVHHRTETIIGWRDEGDAGMVPYDTGVVPSGSDPRVECAQAYCGGHVLVADCRIEPGQMCAWRTTPASLGPTAVWRFLISDPTAWWMLIVRDASDPDNSHYLWNSNAGPFNSADWREITGTVPDARPVVLEVQLFKPGITAPWWGQIFLDGIGSR